MRASIITLVTSSLLSSLLQFIVAFTQELNQRQLRALELKTSSLYPDTHLLRSKAYFASVFKLKTYLFIYFWPAGALLRQAGLPLLQSTGSRARGLQ